MTEGEHNDEAVKVLHRMIAYVRDEATRLHIADVAILLEHAEDALAAFAAPALADCRDSAPRRDRTTLDH